MRNVVRIFDSIGDWIGKIVSWLAPALVALIALEVIMRYFFNSPTMWNFETSMMTGGSLAAMGWAYTYRQHSHVRVDVLYTRLSPRGKALIDVGGFLLILSPVVILFIGTSFSWMLDAWIIGEVSVQTSWYPPMAPFRTVVFLGFILFALQAVAQFIRDLYFLMENKTYD